MEWKLDYFNAQFLIRQFFRSLTSWLQVNFFLS